MFVEFDKKMNWSVFSYFLQNPTTELHVRELSRRIGINHQSVNTSLKWMEENGLVSKNQVGNLHIYKLNNDANIVKFFKITYINMLLDDAKFLDTLQKIDPDIISIVLYGSCATGTYDEKSDIDIILISSKKIDAFQGELDRIEKVTGFPINIEIFTLTAWKKLAMKGDVFYKEVVRNHFILYGSGIE